MPTRCVSGTSSTARVRSIASFSLCLPTLARCERDSTAPFSASSDQPGCLAQGPAEKLGLAGRMAGAAGSVIWLPFQIGAPRWGGVSRRGHYARRGDKSIAVSKGKPHAAQEREARRLQAAALPNRPPNTRPEEWRPSGRLCRGYGLFTNMVNRRLTMISPRAGRKPSHAHECPAFFEAPLRGAPQDEGCCNLPSALLPLPHAAARRKAEPPSTHERYKPTIARMSAGVAPATRSARRLVSRSDFDSFRPSSSVISRWW